MGFSQDSPNSITLSDCTLWSLYCVTCKHYSSYFPCTADPHQSATVDIEYAGDEHLELLSTKEEANRTIIVF